MALASRSRDYVYGLTATRYRGSPTSRAANEGINTWIRLFASATRQAVADAWRFEARVREIQDEWRSRLDKIRRNSATDLLIRFLPGAPIVTPTTAGNLIGRSFPATNGAIERLLAAGILSQVTVGRRNRAFEAPQLIQAFTELERQLTGHGEAET